MDIFVMQICILFSNVNLVWTKSLYGEIDEFIHKLLNSDKFNELADKIAEKAARKIFDLDNIRISHNINNQEENPSSRTKHKSLLEKVEGYNFQTKEGKLKLSTKIIEQQFKQKNELNVKQKISKDISPSTEQLRLKFKNLRVSRDNINKEQNILNSKNDKIKMHKSSIELTKTEPTTKSYCNKQHKSRFEKINNQYKSPKNLSKKNKSNMSSGEMEYIHEDKNEEVVENRSREDGSRKSIADKSSEEKDRSLNIETSAKDVENNNENKHDQNIDSSERNQSQNQLFSYEINKYSPRKEKRLSNEDMVSKMNNRDDRYETEKDSKESNPKDIRKSYAMTTRKLKIRREGDKLFAFENSPDYQEYEEKLASQKVEEKEIAL